MFIGAAIGMMVPVPPNDTSYEIANNNTEDYLRSTTGGEIIRAGQSFKIYSTATLNTVQFQVAKVDTEGVPGGIVAELYAATGTYGSTNTPTGSVLATSTALTAADFAANGTYYTKTFTFATPYTLTPGEYVIGLFFSATHGILTFYRFKLDDSSPTHAGNYTSYSVSGWSATSGRDIGFVIA